MNKLHVCHIISGDLWAGAEAMAFELIKTLQNNPHLSVTAIVLNDGTLNRRLRDNGIKTHLLSEKDFSWLRLAIAIRRLIKKEKINIVHSHRYKENFLAFLASLWLPSIRLIATQHGMPEINASLKFRLVQKLNFLLLSKKFHVTAAVSREMQTILINKHGFTPRSLAIIHNGISIHSKTPVKTNHNHFIIGSAGRFFPVKNYPLMIEIARIVTPHSSIKFILAGDGPQRSELESLIRSYNLEHSFELCGQIDDMQVFYEQLDIFLNTSFHEGIPMTVLEAMSRNVPALVSNTGGLPEIITDGIDGFLIPQGNTSEYAKKCLLLFSDSEMRKRMGIEARKKIVDSFSIQSCTKNYCALYENATLE